MLTFLKKGEREVDLIEIVDMFVRGMFIPAIWIWFFNIPEIKEANKKNLNKIKKKFDSRRIRRIEKVIYKKKKRAA